MKRFALVAVIAGSSFLGGLVCNWIISQGQKADAQGLSAADVKIKKTDEGFTYANAFRVNGTAEEVLVDFGMNVKTGEGASTLYTPAVQMAFSPFTAKRLAITLSEAVRRYESSFGTIELDTSKRLKSK